MRRDLFIVFVRCAIDGATTFEIKATISLRFESSLTTLLAETCQKVCYEFRVFVLLIFSFPSSL